MTNASSLLLWTLIVAGFIFFSWAQEDEANTVEPRSFISPFATGYGKTLYLPGGSVSVNTYMSPLMKTGLTIAGVVILLLLFFRWFPISSYARNFVEMGRQADLDWLSDRVDRALSMYESFKD